MTTENRKLTEFLTLLNLYPSPHNGQPVRLKPLNDRQFSVYFEKERGLQAADISYIFSFVSMGVFIEYAADCARALGHQLSYTLKLPAEAGLRGSGHVEFAILTIDWSSDTPDVSLQTALEFRQTSRKKYVVGLDARTSQTITQNAQQAAMQLSQLTAAQAKQTIWLNQRAVFDDMFDPAVNQELNHWLRYSKAEKETKRDGLSYDCMELNGQTMRWIVKHPDILRAPVVANIIKQYYLRTMTDSSDVFYMLAPFDTELQAFKVGQVITQTWTALSLKSYYLHPFGTIMSNQDAHRDFLKLAGVENESRATMYLVFIFRAGKSAPPVRSLRLPYEKHLLMEA